MQIVDLISAAKKASGLKYNQMAEELHVTPSTFSAWKKGDYKPSASEIAYLAEKAHLSVLETVAEIESQLRPDLADVWKRALNRSKAKSPF